MAETVASKGVLNKICEPLFLEEGPNDTMDTPVTLEGENTLAIFLSHIRGREYSARPFLTDTKIRIEMEFAHMGGMYRRGDS